MMRKVVLAVLGVSATVGISAAAYAQFGAQQSQMVNAGTSTLPPGQYVLTNLNTGLALYVVISQQGQLLAQDPRLLQISAQPLSTQQAQQVVQQQQQQQQPTGFGGLLKQGLGSFLQNQLAPGTGTQP